MKSILLYGLFHLSILSSVVIRKFYDSNKEFYTTVMFITQNKTVHLLFILFIGYCILLCSKIAVLWTFGQLRADEVSELNDKCFFYVVDLVYTLFIFSDDITLINSVFLFQLLNLKCLCWIFYARRKDFVKRFYLFGIYVFIASVFALLICYLMLDKQLKIYDLLLYEFAICSVYSVKNLVDISFPINNQILFPCSDLLLILCNILFKFLFFMQISYKSKVHFTLLKDVLTNCKFFFIKTKTFYNFLKLRRKIKKCKSVFNNENCLICMDDMEEGKKLHCEHTFHEDCLVKWVENKQMCPICRKDIF